MIWKETKKILTVMLSFILLSAPSQILCVYGYQAAGSSATGQTNGGTEGAPMSTEELQSLVAPIALYPDSLVAQILTAATFPDQIAIANYWLGQNKSLTGSALMQAVDKQSWDPSVKALTEFPSVLDDMVKNLTWTSSLGEAYHNQQSEVMAAIQTLRAQAKAKGALKSSSQITVVQQSPQTIVIQPANPQIVYVPQYNPAVVYGYPYVVPGYVAPAYTAGDVAAAGIIGFSAGIAVGALMSGGCCGWGYSSWNCGWHGTAVVYHGGGYYGNVGWHGGYYNGGYHSSYGYNNSFNRNFNNNYNRNTNINRNVNVNNNLNRSNFNNDSWSHSNSWDHNDSGKSSAFSGWGGSHSSGGLLRQWLVIQSGQRSRVGEHALERLRWRAIRRRRIWRGRLRRFSAINAARRKALSDQFGGTYVAHGLEQSGSRTLADADDIVGSANSADIL